MCVYPEKTRKNAPGYGEWLSLGNETIMEFFVCFPLILSTEHVWPPSQMLHTFSRAKVVEVDLCESEAWARENHGPCGVLQVAGRQLQGKSRAPGSVKSALASQLCYWNAIDLGRVSLLLKDLSFLTCKMEITIAPAGL